MSHLLLFGITLTHSYYSNGQCRDFFLVPSSDTEKQLRNHRCVLKSKANGMSIYTETDSDGKPKICFAKNTSLSFELRLKNPEFSLFTDPAPLSDGADYTITNPSRKTDTFFAKIEISRDFNQVNGLEIVLAFSAKPVRWVYFLICNQGGQVTDYSLASQGSDAITWQRTEGMDRVSQKLALQYPGMKRLRFISEQTIPCQESGLKQIQLLYGGNTIIESLPNPSWRNYFQMEKEASGWKTDAIFQVVKILTNTTLTKV